jgi:hypothetical protein
MKLNVPLVIASAIILGGLLVLALWKPEPTLQEITAPSVDYLRSELREKQLFEGKDYRLEPPAILRRAADEIIVRHEIQFMDGMKFREYHRLVPGPKGWEVAIDVRKSFESFVAQEKDASFDRVGKALANRYRDSVNIPADQIRMNTRLLETPVEDSKDILLKGYIDIGYNDRGGEGMYIEEFTFTGGKWQMEGTVGKLFDRGPRPTGRPAPP